MKSHVHTAIVAALLVGLTAAPLHADDDAAERAAHRHLVIVVDGLHPGYVTPELTPNIVALGERGVVGETHTAVYPTYTRVNAASIGTGSYPRTHGLMNNQMRDPAMGDRSIHTGQANQLQAFDRATQGQLLTTITLGEVLDQSGRRLFVTGSGSTGAVFLLNPRGAGMGIWQATGLFLPESARNDALAAVGPTVRDRGSEAATRWVIDAYLHRALGETPPDVTLMWINAPDSAGHSHGVGAPQTLAAVRHVDEQIGRLIASLDEHGLIDLTNIYITSDHGFSTARGGFNLQDILEQGGINTHSMRFAQNMVYLGDRDPRVLRRVVAVLQQHEAVGNIYTRARVRGSSEGMVPGTLSTHLVQWDHPERAADIIAGPTWTDEVNAYGFAGTTTLAGTATHGSDSPYDLHIHLIAAGPDIKKTVRSEVPTSNIDLAPTILHLLGIEPPETMDGRVMAELLRNGPDPASIEVTEQNHRARTTLPDGLRYEAGMRELLVGEHRYLRGAQTERQGPADR